MPNHRDAAGRMSAECLCFRARRVSRAVTRIYDDALRPLGIHATQLTLLNAIAMAGAEGAAMARLADALAMDTTTLSRNLRPLEKAGLLRLARLPADRRVRLAFLTTAGERMIADALPRWSDAHERVCAALGADAAADLRDRLDTAAAATAGGVESGPARSTSW